VSSRRSDARPASRPAGVPGKKHVQQVVVVDRPAGGLPQPGGRGGRARDRSGPTGGHDQPADEGRPVQGNILHDVAAQRPSQEVGAFQAERADELRDAAGQAPDGCRDGAGRRIDAGVIDEDDVAFSRQDVEQRRVPVVDGAAESGKEDERHAARDPEAAVGVTGGRRVKMAGADQVGLER
jgi:hypothetical protein